MSHEIRTPLNGVLGYADLLLDDPTLSGEQRRHVERIQTAGSALLTVVNDVLDLSEIEAGQVELEPRPFSLAALVDNTVSITCGVTERKGLALSVEIGPDLPAEVVGDQDRLRQVLLNLLNNAIKFTHAGSVSLRVAADKSDGDDAPTGRRVRFSVSDTGIGIPADKVGQLFRRFSQIDSSIRCEFGGTGLGLAISKNLVELMGSGRSGGRAALRGGPSAPGLLHGRQGHEGRAGEVEALDVADPHVAQHGQLVPGFDPFRNDLHLQRAQQAHEALHDQAARAVAVKAADQLHVDLDEIGLEVGQDAKPRVARPEVVQGRLEAERLVGADDALDVLGIADALVFRELEDDPVRREAGGAGGFQREADAGFGLVDGVRQEVDGQEGRRALQPEPRRALDGGDPAALVEGVAVGVVHLGENLAGALAVGAPHQGLVGEGGAGLHVHDGLERHGDGERERLPVAASGAAGVGAACAHGGQVGEGKAAGA
jgi:hypothetical protein